MQKAAVGHRAAAGGGVRDSGGGADERAGGGAGGDAQLPGGGAVLGHSPLGGDRERLRDGVHFQQRHHHAAGAPLDSDCQDYASPPAAAHGPWRYRGSVFVFAAYQHAFQSRRIQYGSYRDQRHVDRWDSP